MKEKKIPYCENCKFRDECWVQFLLMASKCKKWEKLK